jgi:hypothetical protein
VSARWKEELSQDLVCLTIKMKRKGCRSMVDALRAIVEDADRMIRIQTGQRAAAPPIPERKKAARVGLQDVRRSAMQ